MLKRACCTVAGSFGWGVLTELPVDQPLTMSKNRPHAGVNHKIGPHSVVNFVGQRIVGFWWQTCHFEINTTAPVPNDMIYMITLGHA
jgi:hypothetical protein